MTALDARVQLSFGEHLMIQATPIIYSHAPDGAIVNVTGYLLEFACGKRAQLYLEGECMAMYYGPIRTRHVLMTGPRMDVAECLFRLAHMNLDGKL